MTKSMDLPPAHPGRVDPPPAGLPKGSGGGGDEEERRRLGSSLSRRRAMTNGANATTTASMPVGMAADGGGEPLAGGGGWRWRAFFFISLKCFLQAGESTAYEDIVRLRKSSIFAGPCLQVERLSA